MDPSADDRERTKHEVKQSPAILHTTGTGRDRKLILDIITPTTDGVIHSYYDGEAAHTNPIVADTRTFLDSYKVPLCVNSSETINAQAWGCIKAGIKPGDSTIDLGGGFIASLVSRNGSVLVDVLITYKGQPSQQYAISPGSIHVYNAEAKTSSGSPVGGLSYVVDNQGYVYIRNNAHTSRPSSIVINSRNVPITSEAQEDIVLEPQEVQPPAVIKRPERHIKTEDTRPVREVKQPLKERVRDYRVKYAHAIIGNRGCVYANETPGSKDARGQDRVATFELSNGIQLLGIFDGAGFRGHVTAERAIDIFQNELSRFKQHEINPNTLIQLGSRVNQIITQENHFDNGVSVDLLIVSNNGRYILHIGEGNIGIITPQGTNKMLEEHKFTQEHRNQGASQDMYGSWRYNGCKARILGYGDFVTPEAVSLPNGICIIASDGFWDYVSYTPIDWGRVNVLIREGNLQAATDYMLGLVNAKGHEVHGDGCDDISLILADLR